MSTVKFNGGPRQRPPRGVNTSPIIWPSSLEPFLSPQPLARTKAQIIMPIVIGVAVLGMLGLMLSQKALRQGPMMGMSLLFPVMMIASMMMMFNNNRSGNGEGQPLSPSALDAKRRKFRLDLDELRGELHEAARAQFNQVQWLHPAPDHLLGLVGSDRQWERSRRGGQ